MTPAEHYFEAEQCLEKARESEVGSTEERYFLAAAKVHATLARTVIQPVVIGRDPQHIVIHGDPA